MAQKRMIDKKISVSEQVANLGEKGALLFTWMIPHADDIGLLPSSARTIKALIVPMFEFSVEDIGIHMEAMRKQNLIEEFPYKGTTYWRLVNFNKEQAGLKKDRQPQTILNIELSEDPKNSWKTVYSILEPARSIPVPEEKRTELKRKEVNNNGNDIATILKNKIIPDAKPGGIQHVWQEKALRYAENLSIQLDEKYRSRWFKMFKEASEQPEKNRYIEKAYTYLADYKGLDNEGKIKMFFWVFNGNLLPSK